MDPIVVHKLDEFKVKKELVGVFSNFTCFKKMVKALIDTRVIEATDINFKISKLDRYSASQLNGVFTNLRFEEVIQNRSYI